MNSRGSSSDPPPPIPATSNASRLAPGFRFHPTDEELVSYYLKRKVCGRPIRVDAVAEVDLYRCEPSELPGLSRIRSRDLEWYFFSPLDRKYSNRSRTNRATPQGYWKTTGKDRPIRRGPRVVGMKKTLVFHSGRAPRGNRTNWVMHEYRLEDEELTQSGISQDAYVVCRIFQKSGSGPQNGAQYGAPFVEEEWEEEEEETDGVVLMPDIGENQLAEVTEQEYFEFSDFLQKEDLKNQNENASRVVGCVEEDCGTPPEDAAILLNETPESTNFTNMVEPIDEPEPQTIQTPIDQMEKKPIVADRNHSQSHPNVKQEYVELNDLAETVNVVYPCGEEIVSYPIRNFYAQNIDAVDGNINLRKMLDVEEFFDFDTMSQGTNLPESLQMTPAGDMNSLPVDLPTDRQPQDDMLLCDTPSDNVTFKHENVEMDGHFYSPSINPSGFEMVDDLLAYFDATEDTLHYDCMDIPRSSECINFTDPSLDFIEKVDGCSCSTRKTTDEAPVPDTSNMGEASSSSASSAAYGQCKDKYKEVTTTPDKQTEDTNNKTPAKHLVKVLGAISAPPAFAAEFPTLSGKAISDISAVQSASSIHVITGIIHIYGSIVPGNAGHWSLQKHELEGYILSYRIAAGDDIRKIAGRTTKNQVDAMSMVIRGGLYTFLISALLLAISYKVVTRFMADRVF